MKKFVLFLLFILFFIILIPAYAEKMPNLRYKNIKNKEKVFYNQDSDVWQTKFNKNDNYFYKTKGFGDFYDYVDKDGNFLFSTNCEYEFIKDDKFIGYSNRDLKFYYITYINGELLKHPLSKEEVENLFPNYKVLCISEFSDKTSSYKIKKHIGDLNIIILNDTDKVFDGFSYTSGNAVFEQYDLKGFLSVSKSGMIQFAPKGENPNGVWYMILVR